MTTGYFSHPDCLAHDMGAGHPECPARIHAIEDHLRAVGLDVLMLSPDVPLASNQDLALAHDLNYVLTLDDFLQQLEATGDTRALDPDTWGCPGTRPPHARPPRHAQPDHGVLLLQQRGGRGAARA